MREHMPQMTAVEPYVQSQVQGQHGKKEVREGVHRLIHAFTGQARKGKCE
jgi:hypothetical protein